MKTILQNAIGDKLEEIELKQYIGGSFILYRGRLFENKPEYDKKNKNGTWVKVFRQRQYLEVY